MGIQRVALEDHGDVALARLELVHAPPADGDLTLGDRLEPRDHAQQRRLAAARGPDQHDEFAIGNVEVDVVHHDHAVEALGDVADVHCSHGRYFTAPSVRPRTMNLWPSAIRSTAGMVEMIDAAAI